MAAEQKPIIELHGIRNQFGAQVVHDNLSVDFYPNRIIGVVGGSGTGKSVLMRTIIGLHRPNAGEVKVLGRSIHGEEEMDKNPIQTSWGVLFQQGALFSSQTVLHNVMAPLLEHTELEEDTIEELAYIKLAMVGLNETAAGKFPSELSGGMRKRVALARALAMDPKILFLDEPTAGLDPIAAAEFDELIRDLQRSMGLTVMIITHDLDTLVTICDEIAVLVDKQIILDTLAGLLKRDHPWIRAYFHGPRARAARKEES